jgi:hypothetical protein
MYNLYDMVVAKRTVSPAVRANGTVNGTAVDRASTGGSDGSLVVIQTGTVTDGSHAVSIEDSDDGSNGWTAVPAGQLQSSAPTIVAADDDKLYEVGVLSSRRYLRVVVVTTGATTGGVVGALVVLGESRNVPVSHS